MAVAESQPSVAPAKSCFRIAFTPKKVNSIKAADANADVVMSPDDDLVSLVQKVYGPANIKKVEPIFLARVILFFDFEYNLQINWEAVKDLRLYGKKVRIQVEV